MHEAVEISRAILRPVQLVWSRADDMRNSRGLELFPSVVEEIVRGIEALGDEFQIELVREAPGSSQASACTIVAEWSERGHLPGVEERLRRALRDELGVTPAIRLESYGTLERTTFKAKRIVERVPDQ